MRLRAWLHRHHCRVVCDERSRALWPPVLRCKCGAEWRAADNPLPHAATPPEETA